MSRRRGRRGIALVGALALLTVSGIVVAALVASSITAQRSMRLGGSDAAALASAEYAASSILAGASTYQLAWLPLGVTPKSSKPSELHVDGVTRLPARRSFACRRRGLRGLDPASAESTWSLIPGYLPLPAGAIEFAVTRPADDMTIATDHATRAAGPGALNARRSATVAASPRPGGVARSRPIRIRIY
jgi:hypothetical protein